jgi:hypothetical protein
VMKSRILAGRTDRIILALLEHSSLEKAAAALGMSQVTVWRWMQKPEFQEAYRTARREAFSRSLARLQQSSAAAASTLVRIMLDQSAPAASRVRAADCVLGHAARRFELEELEARIQRLEESDRHDGNTL